MDDISYTLSVIVTTRPSRPEPVLTANVQVWSSDRHLTTISLATLEDMILPPGVSMPSAEAFAATIAREVARRLDEEFWTTRKGGVDHTTEALKVEYIL